VIVTTTTAIDSQLVTEYMGVVTGEVVLGANVFRDLFSRLEGHSGRLLRRIREGLEAGQGVSHWGDGGGGRADGSWRSDRGRRRLRVHPDRAGRQHCHGQCLRDGSQPLAGSSLPMLDRQTYCNRADTGKYATDKGPLVIPQKPCKTSRISDTLVRASTYLSAFARRRAWVRIPSAPLRIVRICRQNVNDR
jgi:hypothetical protein